jgi:transposase
MSPKHTYFGFSTAQQRKLLFETWEAIGSVSQACQKARVSRGLFYYWKPRYEADGYAGLEDFESRVAHKLNRKPEPIRQKVVEMRREHLDWGKARISQEMAKANNWVPVVSPNAVKHILEEAGLWSESSSREKKTSRNGSTHG